MSDTRKKGYLWWVAVVALVVLGLAASVWADDLIVDTLQGNTVMLP
jgi:hypothetical protein